MASSQDEPYYAVSFVNYARGQALDVFLRFARVLAPLTARLFDARPHWGKLCPIDAEVVERLYPKAAEFRRICESLDSAVFFRNDWADELLFSAKPQHTS